MQSTWAINEVRHARYPRKALLVVPDGMDNHSRYTEGETKRAFRNINPRAAFSDSPIAGSKVKCV
jgi:hypothetical protein